MDFVPWGLGTLGLFLIYLEFFLPGAIMGVLGGLLIFAAMGFFVVQESYFYLFIFFLVMALLLFLVTRLALYQIKKSSLFAKENEETTQSSLKKFVEEKAVADTDLRPSGYVLTKEKQRLQAVSQEGYIEKGSHVIVVAIEKNHLIVRREK